MNRAGRMSGDGRVVDCGEMALAQAARDCHLRRVGLKEIRLAQYWPGFTGTAPAVARHGPPAPVGGLSRRGR